MPRELSRDVWDAWVASRPPQIQAAIATYPPRGRCVLPGRGTCYVVGWRESEQDGGVSVLFSPIDPGKDYDGAVATRFPVCVDCLEAGMSN